MSEGEDSALKAVDLAGHGAESSGQEPQATAPLPSPEEEPATQPSMPAQMPLSSGPSPEPAGERWRSAVAQFKLRRFLVLRPGTLEHAIEDIKRLVNQEENGRVLSIWLLAEVDHWNNERERVVLIMENALVVCKYDFMMLTCEQIQNVPLNYVDRVAHGGFSFPPRSLLKREGEGLRIYWDRQREPGLTSRWNPFSVDYPYFTFTHHPVRSVDEKFAALCELKNFQEQLTEAARAAHARKAIPGKANGVVVLNQPILIEAYIGLMSFIGNQNKLGYCLARGNIGF